MKKKQMLYKSSGLFGLFIIWIAFLTACGEDDGKNTLPEEPPYPEIPPVEEALSVKWTVLKDFTFDELKTVEKKMGLTIISLLGARPRFAGEVQLKTLKVSCKSKYPEVPAGEIDLSGVILMPPAVDSSTIHRIVVAMPYTYLLNTDAPTSQLADYTSGLSEYIAFWLLQAYRGYIVLIPDYPGFGDSYQQCFSPYVESKPMVRTAVDFLVASQHVLAENHYARKDGLIITGYSQGGFTSTALARELETNPLSAFRVSLLYAGGTPCRLRQISDLVRASDELVDPYLMPYSIWGFKKNGYPGIHIGDILKEPYASQSDRWFDGKRNDLNTLFPAKVNELFTDKYIQNIGDANRQIHQVLEENSLTPWDNTCEFVLVHGRDDKTVYFANAKDYAAEHKAAGGKVQFIEVAGNHTEAAISYFLLLPAYLSKYE
jgi:pimeloyl-ACP methyl ester carboxylesterase